MYFDQKWNLFSEADLKRLCELIGPVDGKHAVDVKTTVAENRTLSFYDSVYLIRVKDPAWQPANLFIYYLVYGSDLIRLDGTSPPLHGLHNQGVLRLTDKTVLDYLRFFTFFVRGEEGPFLVVEGLNDTYVPKQLDAATRAAFGNTVRPASYEGRDAHGHWICDAVIYYSNAIFITNYTVQPDGTINMLMDEPVAANLPVKIDAPIA